MVLITKLTPIPGSLGLLGSQCLKCKQIDILTLNLKSGCVSGLRTFTVVCSTPPHAFWHLLTFIFVRYFSFVLFCPASSFLKVGVCRLCV